MGKNLTVIFDFDGTLANTMDLVMSIYNEHAESFGSLTVDKSELTELRRLGYKKAMKAKKIRWSMLPRMVLFLSKEMKLRMDEVPPYPGVVEMLKKLQEKGVSIGVLTSNNAQLVQDFFKSNNFPLFDFIVSEKTLFGKEKALKKIMKRHDLNKDDVIYVGDEPRDVVSCNKAGVKIYGVAWGFAGEEGLEATPPDKLVYSSDELFKEILSQYNQSR